MEKTNQGDSKQKRGGDTSRTSSQGRKEASGGDVRDKRNPEIDEATHSPKKEEENRESKGRPKP